MNLVLLEAEDFRTPTRVRLDGRRFEHVRDVVGANVGDVLRVGRIDGPTGAGHIVAMDASGVELEVTLDAEPPPGLPLVLAVALPRPPSIRKILQAGTALGVKEFVFFASARVEKSYWQSRALRPAEIRHQLCLGLEQARDTRLPVVRTERRLRPFVDALAGGGAPVLLADPGSGAPCPRGVVGPHVLVLGPEGGLLEHERARLLEAGARPITLGPRVLRVETAAVALIARLF